MFDAIKKTIIPIIKIAIIMVIFKFAIQKIDCYSFGDVLYTRSAMLSVFFCGSALVLQHIIAGIKAWHIFRVSKININLKNSIKSIFVSFFISQFGFSFLSGDLVRGAYIYKKYSGVRDIATMIFVDRVTGFIGLTILYLVAVIGIYSLIKNQYTLFGLYILALICLGMILGYAILLTLPVVFTNKYLKIFSNFVNDNRQIMKNRHHIFLWVFSGIVINFFNVIAVVAIGTLLNFSISFSDYFLVTIPAMVISMIPISVAGWGVREGVFIAGFSLLNHQSASGMLISLIFGLSSMLASLPGIVFLGSESWKFKKLATTSV